MLHLNSDHWSAHCETATQHDKAKGLWSQVYVSLSKPTKVLCLNLSPTVSFPSAVAIV